MNAEQIIRVCSVGTGTMGFGTALAFAYSGCSVAMAGRTEASLDRAFNNIKQALEVYKAGGLATDRQIAQTLANIQGYTSYNEAVAGAQFVIESVVEEIGTKQTVYASLEKLTAPNVIFATNTSGLSPTTLAARMQNPERFVVAHFWNPPHLIPLVEVVPGEKTSAETVEITRNLMEKIGKKPIVLQRECLGFLGNRLQYALLREAVSLVEKGIATPVDIDMAVKYGFGRRLPTTGPLESADMGGLDIFLNIGRYLSADLDASQTPSPLLEKAVAEGNLGIKTGKGLQDWPKEKIASLRKKREESLIVWLKQDRASKS